MLNISNRIKIISLIFICCFVMPAWSCTRVLHVDKNQGVMVGRTMDWFQENATNIVVYPKGIAREGNDAMNSLKWVSKYGSINALYHDFASTDGMNEKGLAVHSLWLEQSSYGARNPTLPGLSLLMWEQFYLDNFATVDEAVRYTQNTPFQIISFIDPITKMNIKVHLAIEDETGDSAIIEYQNGIPVVYHNSRYVIMTNDPTYDQQLKNESQYQNLGGDKAIPGSDNASDRFIRAAYHEKNLPSAMSPLEEVNDIFLVLENVSHPPEYRGSQTIVSTIWRSVADLTRHIYYFNSTQAPGVNYTQLDKFNLSVGAPKMKLDLVKNPELIGDVTAKFVPV